MLINSLITALKYDYEDAESFSGHSNRSIHSINNNMSSHAFFFLQNRLPMWCFGDEIWCNLIFLFSLKNHFVIPEGKIVNDALLMRIDKPWKQHRYTLKKDYFDPVNRTREQNYAKQPDGVSDRSWTDLVDYWLLPKTQVCDLERS